MSELERLEAIREGLLEQIQDMTESPRPDYSVDGQSEKWQSLYDSLWRKLDLVERQISTLDGPFEIATRGTT